MESEIMHKEMKLSHESSKMVVKVAHDLGVAQSAFYEWRAQARDSTPSATPHTVGIHGITDGKSGGKKRKIAPCVNNYTS